MNALARFIRRVMRPVRYAQLATATVLLQRVDGKVDVEVAEGDFRGTHSGVTVATPGGYATGIQPGTRCLLSFTDKRQPSIVAWEFAPASAVLHFGDPATEAPVARLGSIVDVPTSPEDTVFGVTLTPTPGVPVMLTGITFAGSVQGQIVDVSQKVKA